MSALVLIASSDPRRLLRLRRMVENEGAGALTASDTREAMHAFVRRAPDLTLLYADSDDDHGIELCRDMKRLRTGRRTSVVVVATSDFRLAAFAAGCDAFVKRENDPGPLARTVRGYIGRIRRSRPEGPITIESVA